MGAHGPSDHGDLRATSIEVVRRLQQAGFDAFWVGGCVRDVLLGRVPHDYDVSTSALPEQVEKIFNHTIPVGRQFGVLIVVEHGCSIQVATFRAEADYIDGRHPSTVAFSHAKADAVRRDFTINGLFHDPVQGQTYDWVGGVEDLQGRVIRTIGDAQTRFSEDHLRLLRAARFAAQLNFNIEPVTLAAVRANAAKVQTVSAERIRDELLKLLSPGHAARGLDLLVETDLLQHVLPEFVPTITSEQWPEFHPEGTVFQHVRLMLEQIPDGAHPLLPWAALLHDIGKPATFSRDPGTGIIHNYGHERVGAEMAEALLARLRFPRKDIDLLVHTVRCHMQFKDVVKMRKSTLRRMLMRPEFDFELQLHRLDCLGSHRNLDHYEFVLREMKELEAQPQIYPPLITGTDLLDIGFKAGPELGQMLSEIREKQLEGELAGREQALDYARKRL